MFTKMFASVCIRQISVFYCVLVVVWLSSAPAKAMVAQEDLSQQIRQDVTTILRSSSTPSRLASNVAQKLSKVAFVIPQKSIDDELATWVRSTLRDVVHRHINVFESGEENANAFVEDQMQTTTRAFKNLTQPAVFYKQRSLELLQQSQVYRTSFNSYLHRKFSPLNKVEFRLPESAFPSDSLTGTALSLSPALQNENSSKVKVDFSNRIESDILQLVLIRHLWLNTAIHKSRDERIYGSDLVSLLLSLDEDLRKQSGVRYKNFKEAAPLVEQWFLSCVHINKDIAQVDWPQFRSFLNAVDSLFWQDKVDFSVRKVPAFGEVLISADASNWRLLSKDEDEIAASLRKGALLPKPN